MIMKVAEEPTMQLSDIISKKSMTLEGHDEKSKLVTLASSNKLDLTKAGVGITRPAGHMRPAGLFLILC